MTCDRLVCANCAGPISEGRCSACRASRQRMAHQQGPFAQLTPAMLVALLVALATVVMAVHRTAV